MSADIFNDLGRVTSGSGSKDPDGRRRRRTTPTQNQLITVNRYRVRFLRADGRNTPGVDVPYGFDGAFTATVRCNQCRACVHVVRNTAKSEAPLAIRWQASRLITTISRSHLLRPDQTGHEDFQRWRGPLSISATSHDHD